MLCVAGCIAGCSISTVVLGRDRHRKPRLEKPSVAVCSSLKLGKGGVGYR